MPTASFSTLPVTAAAQGGAKGPRRTSSGITSSRSRAGSTTCVKVPDTHMKIRPLRQTENGSVLTVAVRPSR
ncbi:hypothetical protein [Streptomyces sp. NPDC093261]|uniref:hypothetical protein n=1 Tax=Streptomyces sp. NPDC093261 TaxID=3366037 RepID=UPI0038158D7A